MVNLARQEAEKVNTKNSGLIFGGDDEDFQTRVTRGICFLV